MITVDHILDAAQRIQPFATKTPILSSSELNKRLQQKIFFKCECFQKTGAFKIRGAANHMILATEKNRDIKHVVANSSGNHAQAVAYVARALGLSATIYANQTISPIKAAATKSYGATLNTYSSRQEADKAVELASQEKNTLWIPPFNHPDVICGQGTAALEALDALKEIDAVFAPCGGGGLLAGSLIATKALAPSAKVIGAEPLNANDAAMSLKKGQIVHLHETPNTLADGAATPAVGEHTFPFLQQLDDFVEVSESRIAYWTQWLQHLLKIHIEPTCAMSMEAVLKWAATAPKNSRALVILSGGNISQASMQKIWADDHLAYFPNS
jgi:threonine dehydratase